MLFDELCIYSDAFGQKQVPIQFALSMQTQVNELDSDRHMCMYFSEFTEAIGRVAIKLEIPNLSDEADAERYSL